MKMNYSSGVSMIEFQLKKGTSMKKTILVILCTCFLISLTPLAQEPFYQEAFRWDVPYVPTPQEVVDEMLSMADIGPNDVLYDLGCGDGRIVVRQPKDLGSWVLVWISILSGSRNAT